MNKNYLWCERYRPETVEDCVLPARIRNAFKSYVKNGEIPNLLLTGIQGSGKTSIAKAVCRDIDAEMLFIDASTDSGKQTIIDMISPFASTVSMMDGKHKVVLLDEADGLSQTAMQALRPNIEMFSKTCRFIFTGNYPAKIIPAIKSRCVHFDFNISKEDKPELMMQFHKRVSNILTENNVEYDSKAVAMFINNFFPDYRKMLNELQSHASAYGKIDASILDLSGDDIGEELYPLILSKKFEAARQWVQESTNSPQDIFNSLYRTMKTYVPQDNQPSFIVIIADYQMKSSMVANQNINTLACITELMGNC